MSRVRQHGTSPELEVQAVLRELGVRYRKNVRSLPGSPDMANITRRFAIFVHGCYWHRHEGCPLTTTPTRNSEFWIEKFTANQARDRRNVAALKQLGFRVCIVWQCETRQREQLKQRLRRCLSAESP